MKTPRPADASAFTGPDGRVVREMFSQVAHRYDFLNHFLSLSIDQRWRRAAVAKVSELTQPSEHAVCLDLCSGTGDLSIELQRRLRVSVVASDFCHPMLVRAVEKIGALGLGSRISTIEADSMQTPFRDDRFDAVTIAFGLRNLEDPKRGLGEMLRVLKKNGALVVLEFSRPVVPVFRQGFQFYFHRILPVLGAWISGQRTAYRYLPESVGRFPAQRELAAMMESVGFRSVSYRNLSGGIAALHWGRK